jgi:hypothetical protein
VAIVRALRRVAGLATLVAVAVGAAVMIRRRFVRARERVDLYFEDGSMATHEEGSPDAARLLPLARTALAAARST